MQSLLSFFQLDKAGAIAHDIVLALVVGFAVTYGGKLIDKLWAKLTGFNTQRSNERREMHEAFVSYYRANPHLLPLINSQLIVMSLVTGLAFGVLVMFTFFSLSLERFEGPDHTESPFLAALILVAMIIIMIPLFHGLRRVTRLFMVVGDLEIPAPEPSDPQPKTSAILERIDRKLSQRADHDK